jgi:hypothetical protein
MVCQGWPTGPHHLLETLVDFCPREKTGGPATSQVPVNPWPPGLRTACSSCVILPHGFDAGRGTWPVPMPVFVAGPLVRPGVVDRGAGVLIDGGPRCVVCHALPREKSFVPLRPAGALLTNVWTQLLFLW